MGILVHVVICGSLSVVREFTAENHTFATRPKNLNKRGDIELCRGIDQQIGSLLWTRKLFTAVPAGAAAGEALTRA